MQTFKQFLSEADSTKGKAVDRDTAEDLFNQIERALRPDDKDNSIRRYDGRDSSWWSKSYRIYDLFTDRRDEEDDDHPNFTGGKQLEKALKPILKGIGWTVSVSEKAWLEIEIKAKKLTAKQIKSDGKKKIESIRDAVRNESFKARDRWDKEFFDEFIKALGNWKKKSITKDEYFKLARRDEELAMEAWAKAK